ncbi:MAG: malto-oligosyltrehalose trehalohydrolase [Acidobacteriota bacterium]
MEMQLGATWLGVNQCEFLMWAPRRTRVELHVLSPAERIVEMHRQEHGYFHASLDSADPGSLYCYRLDGGSQRADPASHFQPAGIDGPSEIIDHAAFRWHDSGWPGRPLEDYVLYELHVGTYSPEGTFDAIIPHLDDMAGLGVTAVELMPVAQFPGERNWGYDGVFPFAVQNSYGGPTGLKRLVDECHRRGLAVVLDVVYNHLGPEGNYLHEFGPYFSERHRTPWGDVLNFDGPESDHVRRFFVENGLYWIREYHVDALRLDAIHSIVDASARPFLQELTEAVHDLGRNEHRRVFLIAESASNDPGVLAPASAGGLGFDAQWNDDFHHAIHTVLTGERGGYYQDFGRLEQLAKGLSEGFIFTGEYSCYRRRRHGAPLRDVDKRRLVVFLQNHDQIGNRARGDRLSRQLDIEQLKLGAAFIILSPYIPLLFMGEEYGETAPFQYFVSHGDPQLIEEVRRGRQKEFASFGWNEAIPDPADLSTYLESKLKHHVRPEPVHGALRAFYRELLRIRREHTAIGSRNGGRVEAAVESDELLWLSRGSDDRGVFAVYHFGATAAERSVPVPSGVWDKLLDSSEPRWHGGGSRVPARIVSSEGTLTIELSRFSCVLFDRAPAVGLGRTRGGENP